MTSSSCSAAGGATSGTGRRSIPDFVVDDIAEAIRRARSAGAVQEGETCEASYGKLAMFADPFGHGFCLIEFNATGYDALLQPGT